MPSHGHGDMCRFAVISKREKDHVCQIHVVHQHHNLCLEITACMTNDLHDQSKYKLPKVYCCGWLRLLLTGKACRHEAHVWLLLIGRRRRESWHAIRWTPPPIGPLGLAEAGSLIGPSSVVMDACSSYTKKRENGSPMMDLIGII